VTAVEREELVAGGAGSLVGLFHDHGEAEAGGVGGWEALGGGGGVGDGSDAGADGWGDGGEGVGGGVEGDLP
jgi:hypothetical protein